MISHRSARKRRRFTPRVNFLETRLALSVVVTCLGQDGHDLVGPDAAQGSDGIQDLHLQLSGLAGPVSQIVVQSAGGFQWATEPDPSGAALAEFFPSASPGQGDLFINPEVKSDLPPPGGSLPLGGSTGNLIGLVNGQSLSLQISYEGQANPDQATVVVSGLVSATLPMPAVPTPADVVGTFQVTVDGQDGTGQPYEQGFVHLVATAPVGVTFSSGTFSQIVWSTSDEAGLAWDSTNATLGHNHIYATLRANTDNVADLYFPPARDEAPAGGSTAPTMLLRVALPGDSTVYATAFVGGAWEKSAMTNPLDGQAPPAPAATEAQLRADLMSQNPEYDTIDLAAGQTIVVSQPLEITHSVKIVGNGATILFQQGTTAAWPANAAGAIYVDAPAYTNIQIELDDFTIRFDQSSPIRWSNPSGASPALWDPENNPGDYQHAVIDTRDSNANQNIDLLTLSDMQVYGPPAFDGSSFASLQAQLEQSGDTFHQYVGEQALDLIRTNDEDSGTITNSTFLGGSIELFGGPWSITDNVVKGAGPFTYSPSAFSLHSPHDVLLEGNQVSQSDPNGDEFRLVNLAGAGFDNTIEGNSFGTGAGQIGNEVSYEATTGQFGGINDPEVILAESTNFVLFEGRPGAISGDGRLLVLPNLRASAQAGATGPGMVVSILAGVNSDGTPNTTSDGEWFRVAQQVSLTSDNTIVLLMEDPLPAMPQGGYYVVEVTDGFVNNAIVNNTIDLTGKSSTGIVLSGEDYGTQITGNQFIGGTVYAGDYTGTAISVTASLDSAPSGSGAFPLPAGWTALPDLGTVISGNTILDSLGGIVIGVSHAVNYWAAQVTGTSETGRTFVTATVTQNTFEWDAGFLDSWASAYVADGNNPAENSTPPTVTIGSGFSAEAPGPYGTPRFPWSVGNAITVNGNDQPVFVDPMENVVTIYGNTTQMITANGSVSVQTGPTGQVYAGTVNGVSESPTIATETFNNQPYFPFNLDNLDITGSTYDPPPPPPPPPSPPPPPPPPTPVSLPPPPSNPRCALVGLTQISLAWSASAGASYYIVARSLDGQNWSSLATDVTATSYTDSGLAYATTYYYEVFAVSAAGASAASAVVSAETGAQPDLLSMRVLAKSATAQVAFTGPVASFTDTNQATGAGRFIATINWGDGAVTTGTVSGGAGSFTILGTHSYATAGSFLIEVTVSLAGPDFATATANGTVEVSAQPKHRPHVHPRPRSRVPKGPRAASARRHS